MKTLSTIQKAADPLKATATRPEKPYQDLHPTRARAKRTGNCHRDAHARAKQCTRRDWRPAYLGALSETGMHVRSCEAARVDRQTVWQERKSNPEFAALETAAREQADLSLVDEAVRRARDGVRTIKFNPKTGEPYLDPETGEPYVEHQYSDALLIRLLAAHMPKVYGNKVELETEVRHRRMTLDELEQRMKDARA